jgi:hypothetical protein
MRAATKRAARFYLYESGVNVAFDGDPGIVLRIGRCIWVRYRQLECGSSCLPIGRWSLRESLAVRKLLAEAESRVHGNGDSDTQPIRDAFCNAFAVCGAER